MDGTQLAELVSSGGASPAEPTMALPPARIGDIGNGDEENPLMLLRVAAQLEEAQPWADRWPEPAAAPAG